MTENTPVKDNKKSEENVSFLSMIQSVFAAIFGIQSDKNRQKDFKKGDAGQFIVLGIVAVVAIMVTMAVVVSSVLESAGR